MASVPSRRHRIIRGLLLLPIVLLVNGMLFMLGIHGVMGGSTALFLGAALVLPLLVGVGWICLFFASERAQQVGWTLFWAGTIVAAGVFVVILQV